MPYAKCNDPKWRRLIFALAALLVLAVALFLYLFGLGIHAGWLYSLSVLVLVVFALAGAVALAFLVYSILREWCELRGAPPKGSGTREPSGPSKVHLPSTIYKKPDPLIYSQYYLMARASRSAGTIRTSGSRNCPRPMGAWLPWNRTTWRRITPIAFMPRYTTGPPIPPAWACP
jgi:hypothetical protein